MIFKPIEDADRRRLAEGAAASTCWAPSSSPSRPSCTCKPAARSSTSPAIHAVETTPLVAPYAAAKAALLSLTRIGVDRGQAPRASAPTPCCPARSTRRCCGTTRTSSRAPRSIDKATSASRRTSPPRSPSWRRTTPPSSPARAARRRRPAGEALAQFPPPQPQHIGDHGRRAEAHRQRGDHWQRSSQPVSG